MFPVQVGRFVTLGSPQELPNPISPSFMRWTRILLVVLAVILLVVGAGAAFVLTLDLNDYKATIERIVVRQTGREFVIDGRIDLDLGGHTGLTVTDVRLGNPGWAAEENMARVGRASVVLDLRSLWSGPLTIMLLELDNAELNIEKRVSGENNWTFGEGGGEGGGLIPLFLHEAHVANFELTVTTPALERPLEIRIDRLDQVQDSDRLFDAKLRGTLNGRPVNLTGKYGPLDNLLAVTDVTIDITGQFDTLSLTVDGLIDDLTGPRQPRIEIEIAGPDIDDVTEMLGLPDFGSGDLDLALSLRPETNAAAVSVVGRIGEHHIESIGTVSDVIDLGRSSMHISAHGPDLSQAGQVFGLANVPGGSYELSGSVHRDGSQLTLDEVNLDIGEAKFRVHGTLMQFPKLIDATLSVDFHGENIGGFARLFGLPGLLEGPFEAAGELAVAPDGTETVQLDVTTQVIDITLAGIIGEGPSLAGTRVNVAGRGADIGAVATAVDMPIQAGEPFAFEGDIELGEDVVLLPEDVTVTVGNNRLVATGVVGFEPLGDDTDLRVRINGADLSQLTALAGITEGVPAAGYAASGRFRSPPEGYRITGFQAEIGAATFTVDGMVSRTEDFVGTRLKLDATVPQLGEFITETETMRFPDGSFGLSGEFELLADAVRLKSMDVKLGDATGTINADVGLPLESASGTFDVQASGRSFHAVFPDTGPWEPPEMPFEIHAQGRLEDGLLHVKPVAIQIGESRVTAEGVVDMPPDASRTSLTIAARTADLSTIGTFNERRLPNSNLSLDAKFSGTLQSYSIEELTILAGDSDLTGSLIVHLDREIPEIKLQLQSNLLDVTPLMASVPESESAVDEKPAGDGRLIPDWQLPLEQLTKFNARVDIDIASYRQNQREIDNLELDATVRDGRLDVERASGTTAYGDATATLHIVPTDVSAMVRASFEGDNMLLGASTGRSREEIDAASKYDISISLDGVGQTLRAIAASLNGQVDISADSGKTPNSSLRFIYGNFFEELLTTVNPFAKTEPYTKISCIVAVANINNGLVDADPGLVIQTDKMNIISRGSINLRNEKIDFDLKTGPRKKISISAGEFINPYIKVAGTLSEPRLMLDTSGTLVTGGAAVATAGLSLLATAIWDRVSSVPDPCGEVVRQVEKKRQKVNSEQE